MLHRSISVIMPVFNGERYIKSAIDCIKAQSLQPVEIIIVNDGSTDNTKLILNTFNDPTIKAIEQSNKGVSNARNNGVKKSIGDFLVFMDVDDIWHPHKLEIQLNELLSGNYGMLNTQVVRIGEADNSSSELTQEFNKETISTKTISLDKILYKPHLTTSSVMVTREAYFDVGGFDETFKTAEDQVFYMDVAVNYKVGGIMLPLTLKRTVENSLSSSMDTYADSLKALDRFEEVHTSVASQNRVIMKKARARIYHALASELIWKRDLSSALKPILLSIVKNPTFSSFFLLIKYMLLTLFRKNKFINE